MAIQIDTASTELVKSPNKPSITETIQDNLFIRICKFPNGVTLRFIDSADGKPMQSTAESTIDLRFDRGRSQEKGDSLHYYEHLKIQQLINLFPAISNSDIECTGNTGTNAITFHVATKQRQNIPAFTGIIEALATPLQDSQVNNLGQLAYINSEMQVRREKMQNRIRAVLVKKVMSPRTPVFQATMMMQNIEEMEHANYTTGDINRIQGHVLSAPVTITATNVGPVLRERIERFALTVANNRKSVLTNKLPPLQERGLSSTPNEIAVQEGESENNVKISFLIPLREIQGSNQQEDALFNLFISQVTSGSKAVQREISFTSPGIYWGHAFRDDEIQAFSLGAEVPIKDAVTVTKMLSLQIFSLDAHEDYIKDLGWNAIQNQLISAERDRFLKDPTRLLFWTDIFGKVVTFPMLENMIRNFTAEQYLKLVEKICTARQTATIVLSSPNPQINNICDQIHNLRISGKL